MAVRATPIIVKKMDRGKGGRNCLFYVQNTGEEPVELIVEDVEKPAWITLEGVYPRAAIHVPEATTSKPGAARIMANINAGHPHFPHKSYEGSIIISFQDEQKVEVRVIIEKISEEVERFKGSFAMDFGTTNSCFAYRRHIPVGAGEAWHQAKASEEMPSLIFFSDVSNAVNPEYVVGVEGSHKVREHSSMVNSYFLSVKRLLGEPVTFTVTDMYANVQKWHVEEVAAFIIKEFLRKAEERLGERVDRVVATYPTLFNIDRKEAIKRSFMNALRMLGVSDVSEKSVIMALDETSSAAFNYIHNHMLTEFKTDRGLQERTEQLLVFDFGGGTIDICLVDAGVTRERKGEISIETNLRGLSGEAFYGGDNVTLALFKSLKKRLAMKVAEEHKHLLEEKEEEKEEAAAGDVFGASLGWGTKKKDDAEVSAGDIFGMGVAAEKKEEKPKVELRGDDLDEIVNRSTLDEWKDAVGLVLKYGDVIEKTITTTRAMFDCMVEREKADGDFVDERQSRDRTRQLEDAVERLVPTCWSRYEGEDPELEMTARRLFYELWHEADALKIRLSSSGKERMNVQSTLTCLAKYTGTVIRPEEEEAPEEEEEEKSPATIFEEEEEEKKEEEKSPVMDELTIDPVKFNEVTVSMSEMNVHVEGPITEAIKKAHNLWKKQSEKMTAEQGLVVLEVGGPADKKEQKPLKVILAGNSSRLPIVQEKVRAIFNDLPDNNFVISKKEMKTAVATGACEEWNLRSRFGEEGHIRYSATGFLQRIPYSIGLLHEKLELLDPRRFPKGFYTVFERGTEVGTSKEISKKDVYLIHEEVEQLVIFADYHDGADPRYLGYIDFTMPVDRLADFEPPAEGEPFKVRFELLENREIRVINLATGEILPFIPHKEEWDERYPFSGFH